MPLDQKSLDRLKIDRDAKPQGGGRAWVWGMAGLLILLGLGLGWGRWRGASGAVLEVSVGVVQEAAAGESAAVTTLLNASGYVTPRREATVSAKVTGKVIEVLVEEGKRVEANQVLARLDPANVLANQQLAQAQLDSARVAIQETQAQLAEAETRMGRARRLLQDRIGTQETFDKAEAEVAALRARLAKQTLDIAVAERSLGLWAQQLEDLTIRAPFAGVVTVKNAQPGEVISPMSAGGFTRTGICTLVDMESLEIEVDVNESYINRVTPGQTVEATLDAYTDWKIPCQVIAIIPTADRQKATVKVRVGFEKLDPRILPQMGVKVAFQAPSALKPETAVAPRQLVPRSAVREVEGKQIVWVVKEGRVERRAIKAESFSSEWLRLVAGLRVGDRVVLDPPSQLTEQSTIRERKL